MFAYDLGSLLLTEFAALFLISLVESIYLNIDMCKCESSQKDECRTWSAGSSKACSKPRAFNYRRGGNRKFNFLSLSNDTVNAVSKICLLRLLNK